MGPYKRGQPVNIIERFFVIDPLTKAKTPADPTTVVFTVMNPNDVEVTYTFGTDANVTKPMVGVYVCALAPPAPPGIWTYQCDGSGAVVATSGSKKFEVLDSDVLPLDPAQTVSPGPCSSWIDGSDVAACCPVGEGVDPWDLDDVAAMASQLLYELSGRQFNGICERRVRPCRQMCTCFGQSVAAGLGPWFWTSAWFGGAGMMWRNEGGDKCGCGTESYIRLSGYPIREILEVKIDGVDLDPSKDFRLDGHRRLIRLSDPGPPEEEKAWPACQDLSLDDDQPGTMMVRYTWGTPPPELGKRAAAQLACEMWNACTTGTCKLPNRVTRVVRAGVTVDRIVPTADLLRAGGTGLPLVDMFIAQVNPYGMRRRPAVFSPDLQPYARRVGEAEH